MLSITRTLPEDSPLSLAYGADLFLDVVAGDDDERVRYVQLDVDFGDGSEPYSVESTTGSISYAARRSYEPGLYSVTLTLSNRIAPRAQRHVETIQIAVTATETPVERRVIFGPILPRDNGHPNKSDWLFNMSKDDRMIESAVKMLFLTDVGERAMQRDYGTRVRSMLFDPNTPATEEEIRSDIQSSLARWVPLADLVKLATRREGRKAEVEALLQSRLSDKTFSVQVTLAD